MIFSQKFDKTLFRSDANITLVVSIVHSTSGVCQYSSIDQLMARIVASLGKYRCWRNSLVMLILIKNVNKELYSQLQLPLVAHTIHKGQRAKGAYMLSSPTPGPVML